MLAKNSTTKPNLELIIILMGSVQRKDKADWAKKNLLPYTSPALLPPKMSFHTWGVSHSLWSPFCSYPLSISTIHGWWLHSSEPAGSWHLCLPEERARQGGEESTLNPEPRAWWSVNTALWRQFRNQRREQKRPSGCMPQLLGSPLLSSGSRTLRPGNRRSIQEDPPIPRWG